MKGSSIISAVCATVLCLSSLSSQAALLSTFAFQSVTSSCISEVSTDCANINANGLTGIFQVDLDALDASGNGSIAWHSFTDFAATNSVSNWNLGNLRAGGVVFNNWTISDFGIDAFPDYSAGWTRSVDGGGELLLINGFGVSASAPAFSNAGSMPGRYCPSTGEWNIANCPGGDIAIPTLGIQATYTAPAIHAIPAPAAIWLFGSGLLGLMGLLRRWRS